MDGPVLTLELASEDAPVRWAPGRNLLVTDLPSFIERRTPVHGRTRPPLRFMDDPFAAARILLVDDSCLSGETFRHAIDSVVRSGFTGQIVTCAAIVDSAAIKKVDIWFEEVPLPRVFEWNLFYHHVMEESCVDFDGVLCADPTDSENDDGPRYEAFLATAAPLHVPSRRIGHVVSARLEKYRKASEEWLAGHGIQYGQLHLLDLPSRSERLRLGAHHKHKSDVYRRVGAPLFIESDSSQAAAIAQSTGRPVLCTADMRLYAGNGIYLRNVVPYIRQQRGGVLGAMKAARRKLLTLLRGAR